MNVAPEYTITTGHIRLQQAAYLQKQVHALKWHTAYVYCTSAYCMYMCVCVCVTRAPLRVGPGIVDHKCPCAHRPTHTSVRTATCAQHAELLVWPHTHIRQDCLALHTHTPTGNTGAPLCTVTKRLRPCYAHSFSSGVGPSISPSLISLCCACRAARCCTPRAAAYRVLWQCDCSSVRERGIGECTRCAPRTNGLERCDLRCVNLGGVGHQVQL